MPFSINLNTRARYLARAKSRRTAQPKTLSYNLFATAARYVITSRHRIVDIDPASPQAPVVHDALKHLAWLARLAPA